MEQKFTQWSQLIMCGKIKPNEKIVLMVILNCNNMDWKFIAHSEIMKQSGLKETAVKEAIKTLRKMGLITKVKTDINNMNNYIVSGFNLNGLMTSGSYFDPLNTTETTSGSLNDTQVGRKTPVSGSLNACNNNILKENKKEYIDNNIVNMDYTNSTCSNKEKVKKEINKNNGKLNRKVEILNKQNNNNMIFINNQMKVTNNSQPAVQSDDWTKDYNKENNAHSSMRIVQYGDSPKYLVQNEYDYSSILDTIPSVSPSRVNKHIQQVTPHTEQRDTHSPKPQENGTGGDNSSTMDNCTTPTLKTQQDANMDGYMSIDELELMYNGGQTIPNSSKSNNAHLTDNSNNGGGRKFTNRKEWEIQMRVALQHIGNSSDLKNKLTGDDLKIITEGTNDKYRVIDTLKAIQQMLTYRVKFKGYDVWLNNAIDTMEANEDVYTPKQYDYACELYDDCVDRYLNIINDK